MSTDTEALPELPEPFMELNREIVPAVYQAWAEQMRAMYQAGRAAGLEDAAKACEDVEEKRWFGYKNPNTFQDAKWKCVDAIRLLK